jgi:DNA-binding response OmpR family regulator
MDPEEKILIIDPDPEYSRELILFLEAGGLRVTHTPTGGEAFACLRSRKFGLLVLELALPDVDGICLLSMVHKVYPSLPVLVLTADNSVDPILKAHSLGARGYLLKSLSPESILACIQEILIEKKRPPKIGGRIRPHRLRRQVLDEWDDEY